MEVIKLKKIDRQYKNNGQHAEQVVRFTLTGEISKADNIPYDKGADINDLQIKSARASVCKGTDLLEYLARDKATRYGYVTSDFTKMYIMNRAEYILFVVNFGTVTKDSLKNGGHSKIKLKGESRNLLKWLEDNL